MTPFYIAGQPETSDAVLAVHQPYDGHQVGTTYGGVKGSGVGREGLASAMEDYTEPRIMVLTGLDL